jgi:hypothetical protein
MAKQKSNLNNPTNPTNPKTPQKKEKGTGEEQVSSSIAKLEKERKQLLVQIAQIKKTITGHDKANKAEMDKIVELEKTRKKVAKEYYEISQKLSKLKREDFERLKKTEKIEKDRADKLKDDESSFKTIRDYNKELAGIQENSVALMRSMSAETQNQSKLIGLTVSNTKALADEMKDANIRSTQSTKVNEAFSKTMEGTVNIAREMDSMESKIAEGIDNLGQRQYEMIDLYQLERDIKQQIALVDLNADKMGEKRAGMQKNVLKSYENQLQRVKSINKSVAQQSQEMYKTKQATVDTQKAMAGVAAAVPAGGLHKKMEMDKAEKSTRNISDRLVSLKNKIKGAFEVTFNFLSGVFSFATTIIKFFFGAALQLDEVVAKIGVGLNVTRGEAIKVTQQFADMAMKVNLVGVNWEQFLETTKQLSDEFGIDPMKMIDSKEAMKNVEVMTILREKFQLTTEDSQKFFELSVIHGKTMDQMVMSVDKMSKGIMNSRSALKALAAVPKSIQVNMKDSLKDLIHFANKAKQLGMDMDQFKSTGDFLMDIEASLEAEMISTSLSGTRVANMDAIRLAFFEGESAKALDLLDQSMGSLADFEKLKRRGGVIAQDAFAKQFGMDREKLVDMLTRKDAMKKLGLSMQQAAILEAKNSKELREYAKQAALMGKQGQADYANKLALEKENATLMQRYDDQMTKIKLQVMQTALPILDVLHQIMTEIINSGIIRDIIDGLNGVAKPMADILAEGIRWALKGIRYILDLFKQMTSEGKGFGEFLGELIKMAGNAISGLFGGVDLFPTDGVKKMGDEVDKANKKLSFMSLLTGDIGGFFEDLGGILMKFFSENKTLVYVVGGFIALWKILGLFGRGKTGLIGSLVGLAGAIWVISDAAEKLAKAGTDGQIGLGIVGAMIGGIMFAMKALKGSVAAAGEIAIVVGTIYAIAGAIYAFAKSAELFAEAAHKTAKSFEIIQNLDWGKIYKAADAMDEFFKKMGKGEGILMKSFKETFLGVFGTQSPLEKIVDFIAKINMNRIMAFSGTMKHLAVGLKNVSEALEKMDDKKINALWDFGKALDFLVKSFSKSMDDRGNSKLVSLFGILNVMEATKVISLSNAIFYMAQSLESVGMALNKLDVSKLNSVSLKMQGKEEKRNTGLFGSITSLVKSGLNKVSSFFGFGEDSNKPVVNIPPPPKFATMRTSNSNFGNAPQTQNVNLNTERIEQKLDTMIKVLSSLSTQKAEIKFGERFIEEISVSLNARSDVNANVDNSTGRFLKR